MNQKGTWTEEDLDEVVRAAVSTALTEKQREAVEMFFFEGLAQSEIARRLVMGSPSHGSTG